MNKVRVAIVDDHPLVRRGVRGELEADRRIEIVGEAGDGEEARALVADEEPDVVLLDLMLGDESGIDLCRELTDKHPESAVIVLTGFMDRNLVDSSLRSGASGYLLKDAKNLHLCEQVLTAADGHTALDPRAADMLADYVHQYGPPPGVLTRREMQTLRLIAQGKTNREIGAELHLSEHTVKGHATEILEKLGVHSRVEAVLIGKERGLI